MNANLCRKKHKPLFVQIDEDNVFDNILIHVIAANCYFQIGTTNGNT